MLQTQDLHVVRTPLAASSQQPQSGADHSRGRALDEKEFSVELTRKMGELGLLGCLVPEKYGGSNIGYDSHQHSTPRPLSAI